MAIRYAFGVVLGLVTTFVLFMIMQSVIKSDRNPFTDAFDGKIVDIVRLDEDQEIEVKKRKPPKPPPPDEPPPDMPKPDFDNSAVSTGVDIGAVDVNVDLLEFYRKLIAIRTNHPALLHGSYRTVLADDKREMLVFERVEGKQRIWVVLNNSGSSQELALEGREQWVDLLGGGEHAGSIAIPPKWGAILMAKTSP